MASTPPMIHGADKLTNEIFAILENKFLFGCHHERLSLTSLGKVRVLSIDAGGSTDGILAAKTLLNLQTILRRKSGIPTAHIADFFDVATGAGTGGVLAALLFTRGPDRGPMFTAEDSLKFVVDNYRKLNHQRGVFGRRAKGEKVLKKVFGDLTLRDTVKAVLIPCYDLRTGAAFVFSRADALEMEGCDFRMAGVCRATVGERAMELKSTDGARKIVAVGGGVGMSNPTAAAITHVLNNKREFPFCKGLQDLLVLSLGNGESSHSPTFANIAAQGAADMVDQAVSMAFGESRTSNYVRIQGNGRVKRNDHHVLRIVDEMLVEKNVESVLFKGKKLVEYTNMEKVEMFGGEILKEEERRKKGILPPVILKNTSAYNTSPPRSSSATTLSTPSS